MPKYLLHGGHSSAASPLNDDLYDEIARFVPDGGVILMCYFAREQSQWIQNFTADKKRMEPHFRGKDVNIYMAAMNHFEEAFDYADVVFFRDGSTSIIMENKDRMPNLKSLIEHAGNKMIIGESAGANLLAAAGCGVDGQHEGLGVIPQAVWVHCDNPEHQKPGEELKKRAAEMELPVIELPEHTFVTF